MRFFTHPRPWAAMLFVTLLASNLFAAPLWAQPKQATGANALSGTYFAHDLYEIFDDTQTLGRGFRTFNANGIMGRLFTYPASTTLNFEIETDATYRIFSDTFNSGFTGTVGLGGDLALFTLEAAPNADAQVRAGYASLHLSVRQGTGMEDGDFNGSYSYHALLRTSNDTYRTSFGLATTSGKGSMVLIREAAVGRTFAYGVESDGRIALIKQDSTNAAVVAGGALVINTARVDAGDDAEINGGYTGLALYLRRFPANNGATMADFRGTYRVHRISANGSATPASDVGAVTAGGNGYFFGELGGQAYDGQIDLNASGTFTFAGSAAFQGTLGADGGLAVVTTIGGANPFMEIWARTAGGAGNALDGDGDGLTDGEEDVMGTDPDDADSDNDGLLDNTDERPNTADNVVQATLSQSSITADEGDTAITNVTLTLDANDFPFFEWEVSSAADWVSFDTETGIGDDTIGLTIDLPSLEPSATPHVAVINIDAPDMADVAPLSLSVTLTSPQVDLALTPEALTFTLVEGGASASATVRVSSPDANIFVWTASTEFPWITVTPRVGAAAGDVTIEVDPADLVAGESPYAATVLFRPAGVGPKQKALAITAHVVSDRAIDVPFVVAESDVAQSRPAAAFDEVTGTWVIAWVEEEQIIGALFDEALVPLGTPVQLSLSGLGTATNPTAVALSDEGEAWVIWEQYATGSSDALLQAKAFNLATRSPGNAFGFSSGTGNKTRPQAVYNAETNQVAIAFGQEVADEFFIGLVRVNASSRGVLSSGFAAPGDNPQTLPSLAWLADTNEYLLAWREDIPVSETTTTQVRAARLAGDTGAVSGEILVVDGDAPDAANVAAAASAGLNRWIVAWSEGAIDSATALNTATVDTAGTASAPRSFDGAQQPGTPVALGYNGASKQAILLWSRDPAAGDPVAVYQTAAGNGQVLGDRLPLPDNPAAASSAAASANALANEFLLIWEDPAIIPRQLRALRIAGGSDDVDQDGLPNDWELEYGLDPASGEGDEGPDGDPDRDGLSNLAEFTLGTDPTNPDSDDDGLLDGQEDRNSDGAIGEGETSPLNTDSDGDGVGDDVEWFLGSDGSDGGNLPDSGIYRVNYGAWIPGQAGELSVSFYVAGAGNYALEVNPDTGAPEGWSMVSDDDGTPHAYEAGAHTLTYAITPAADLSPGTAYATFHFVLSGGNVQSARTSILVADLLETVPETAEALARAYAPVLRLHRDALFSPMPVEVSLNAATLDLGNTMTLIAQPRDFDLGQSPHREAFVDLPGTDTEALFAAYPEASALPEPQLYYTVTPLGDTSEEEGANPAHLSIQYYLHFFADVWGLDQQGGHRHEGDWEVFQVLLDEDQIPYRAATTQQWQLATLDSTVPGGEGRDWADVEVMDGTRPVLYVGQGGNALYFYPGATHYNAGSELHDGLGHWLLPDGSAETDYGLQLPLNLAPLGRLHEAHAARWLPFAGAWGQPNYPVADTDDGDPAINDGPVGPVFLGTTLDPANEDGVARIWSDPFAFARRMPALPQGLTTQVRGTVPESLWGKTLLLLDSRGRVFSGETIVSNGSFDITAPLQPFLLAVLEYDTFERPVLLAAAHFTAGLRQTPLFPAVPDVTAIGALELAEGVLTGAANYAFVDSDGDGTPNGEDLDMDGDGNGNANDLDMLGDGWDDAFQAQDPDGDGIPSYLDEDDDGDASPDAEDPDRDGSGTPDAEEPDDTDGDGFVDALDLDMDNDGFDNATEEAAGSDPRHYLDTPTSKVGDLDQDGEVDAADGQQLINLGLGRGTYTPRADYNLNGFIDAVDLQSLINEILAGNTMR